VSNYQLNAEIPLAGYSYHFDGVDLFEIRNRAMVSMATPKDGELALECQLKQAYGLGMPDMGQWLSSDVDHTQFLRLQDDLCFVLFDYSADRAMEKFTEKISEAYFSEQSDSWVMLRLSGEKSREALARICPVDLHPGVFKPGCVTRTVMEHIGTIIVCEAEQEYTLMALRSYAGSFLHAIELSIKNVTP